MIIEVITILYALLMEATVVTWPERDLQERLPFLKKRNVWAFGLTFTMFVLSISYLVFGAVWFLMDAQPFRFCGGILITLSALSFLAQARKVKRPVFLKRIDGAISFVCVALIGYARFLWGF